MSSYLKSLAAAYTPPRFPQWFEHSAHCIRGGLAVAIREHAHTEVSIAEAMLRFAFVHYARVGFINEDCAESGRWTHEPLESLSALDRHIVVGDAHTGEVIAYATFKSPVDQGKLCSDSTRAWFAVERAFGRDVFKDVAWLDEVVIEEVREIGRVVRSAYLAPADPRSTRASAELLLACMREIVNPANRVSAVVGDGEPDIMVKNVRLLGAKPKVFHGMTGCLPAHHIYSPRYVGRVVCPFVFRVADINPAQMDVMAQVLEDADTHEWQRKREYLRGQFNRTVSTETAHGKGNQA